MKTPFLEQLGQRILLCDGAMGTLLYGKGVFINRCFDELNLSNPRIVQEVHQGYVRCGVDIIEANTFGANRIKLTGFGLADKTHAINLAGVRLARACAGDSVYVAGSVGPLGIRIEPWGKMAVDEAKEIFKEQVAGLLEGGIDLFMLETFYDLNEMHAAILAVRELADLPLVAQMTLEDDGNSLEGTAPEIFGRKLDEWGADVIGLNCSVGPQVMLESIERIAAVTDRPLSAQPNAGKPKNVDGRNIYLCSPEYMGSYAKRFIRSGVRIVGGCCGTTPDHIRAMSRVLQSGEPARRRIHLSVKTTSEGHESVRVVPTHEKSMLAKKLREGQFVTSAEVLPPRGFDWSKSLQEARRLKLDGIDVINISEGPRASARMSSQAMAIIVEKEAGIETVLHYSCRDRSLLAMQSDILGLYALGVRNLLVVTGDTTKLGDYADAGAVFEVDSIGLTNMVNYLNHGLDLGGDLIGQATGFFVGVEANPTAVSLDEEVKRFDYKVEAGAEFCITQPIFDVAALERFLRRIEHHRIPIIAAIWFLASYRYAEFMNNEVPGRVVPERMLERMRRAGSKEEARLEGVAIAREVALQLRPMVQGLQIRAPMSRYDAVSEVMRVLELDSGTNSPKLQEM